jgi:hypothetical protein
MSLIDAAIVVTRPGRGEGHAQAGLPARAVPSPRLDGRCAVNPAAAGRPVPVPAADPDRYVVSRVTRRWPMNQAVLGHIEQQIDGEVKKRFSGET